MCRVVRSLVVRPAAHPEGGPKVMITSSPLQVHLREGWTLRQLVTALVRECYPPCEPHRSPSEFGGWCSA